MDPSAGSNAITGLKIAGFVILAVVAWKVLAFLSGVIWFVLKVAVVLAIAGGAVAVLSGRHRRRGLPGGWRSLP